MKDTSAVNESNKAGSNQSGGSNSLRSRDEIVDSVVRIYEDEAGSAATENSYQLRRLIQALNNRKGHFGLLFAVCNDVTLRKKMTQQIVAQLRDQTPIELHLNGSERSLLNRLLETPDAPNPLIVYGLELLLPSGENQARRREKTLHELQLRREQFRNLGRPLLLWMPEYVYTMIGQEAVDFWSWQSGGFFFTSDFATTAPPAHGQQNSPLAKVKLSLSLPDINFIGREQEIIAALKALREGKIVIVSGMAGVGKTVFANVIARRLKDDYPDGLLQIRLSYTIGNQESVIEGLKEAIRYFRPDENLPGDLAVLKATYRSLLTGKRALIVIDDAMDSASVEPFIPPDGCALIVTSRRRLMMLPGQVSISFDQRSPEDANALLWGIGPRISPANRHAAYYLSVLETAGNLYFKGGDSIRKGLAMIDLEWPNIKAGQAWASAHREGNNDAAELCNAYADVGWELIELRQPARENIRWLEAAFAAASQLHKRDAEGRHVNRLGIIYANLGDAHRAIAYYVQALAIFREIDDRKGQGISLTHLGNAYLDSGRFDEAIATYNQSLSIAVEIGDRSSEAATLYQLGLVRVSRGEPDIARECLERVLTIARDETGDRRLEGHILSALGLVYYSMGDSRQTIELCESALIIAREIGDSRAQSDAIRILGKAYEALGETQQAISYYENSLRIARELGDRVREADSLGNLSEVYQELGNARLSIEYAEQSLSIFRELGYRNREGSAMGILSMAYLGLGDFHRAIEFSEQALTIAYEFDDRRAESIALGNLGIAYASLGSPNRAMEFFEKQLDIALQLNDRRSKAQALANISQSAKALGRLPQAREYAELALRLFEQIEDPKAATIRQRLAELNS